VSEKEILDKIKSNPLYFSKIFDLYYKPVFGYIFRRIGSFDDTADIAADTFLKAFAHIHQFSYRGISIKVWLYRIATNEVNLYYRNQQKHTSLFERNTFENLLQFNHYFEEDKKILDNELLRHDQFSTILKHLKELPTKYQEVITLRYFEDKDNKEIAEILEIKEGTLKSLLSRGVEKLRIKCNQI